jgi:hypothetical protein
VGEATVLGVMLVVSVPDADPLLPLRAFCSSADETSGNQIIS